MAAVVRVRVENRNYDPNASANEQYRAFKSMLTLFKRKVNEAGILTTYKQYQAFESKSQKLRRKKKEAALRREKELREKLREHFG